MMDPAAASSMTMAPCPGDDEPSSPSLLCHCGGRVEFPAGVAPAGSQSVPYLLAAPAAGATARKGMAISRGHKLRLTTLSCLPNSLLTKRDVLLVQSPGLREI